MGVFRQFPYSNFHEMNMDEIIKIVKNMLEEWAQYHAEWDAWMNQINDDWSNYQEVMNEAWQNMQNFINNYFDNLDVQNEINNKITDMIHTGEFSQIVDPYVPPAVSTWLSQHITTPETVVIDDSLTISGAAADAKATGDAIGKLNDFNSYLETGYYINYVSGRKAQNPDYNCVVDYPVREGTALTLTVSSAISSTTSYPGYVFYDANKTYLSGASLDDVTSINLVPPTGAKYLSFSFKSTATFSVRYTNFTLSTYKEIEDIMNKPLDGVITYTVTPTFTDGGYINVINRVATHTDYSYSEYVDVKAFKKITFPMYLGNNTYAVFVDETKENIIELIPKSGSQGDVIDLDVPAGACWFRTSCYTNKVSNYWLVGTFDYIQKTYEMASVPVTPITPEDPLDNIISDGGYTKIFRTMGVVGDSLSSGEMAYGDAVDESTTHYVDMYEYSWIQYMARYCGSTAYNFSAGGISTRTFFTSPYYTQMMDGDHNCQAYFIALCHNDRNQSVPIGSEEDINLSNPDLNEDTYYGNYAKIISKIKTVVPDAKIFCVLSKFGTFDSYNAAVEDIAELFDNVYVLDMRTYSPPFNDWEYTQGHGNAMGYLNYSYQISSYVDYIIRHNRNDFKYVQFIGTEYEYSE